jgi:branched-chain amino acid transport system permease protein
MVIGGAGSIIGALIGGAYYVFVPQLTNAIDPNLTTVSQGAILLVVLFLLPQGLVSLPRVIRRLSRRRPAGTTPPGNPPQNSPVHQPATEAAREGLEKTERQDRS